MTRRRPAPTRVSVTEACDDSCPVRLGLLLYLRWLGAELEPPALEGEPVDKGSVVHDVLDRTNEAIAASLAGGKVMDKATKDALVHQAFVAAKDAIEAERGTPVKVSVEDVKAHLEKKDAIAPPGALARDRVLVEREQLHSVALPGNLVLTGKIDEIQHAKGHLKVIDVKTGRHAHPRHRKQVQLYGEILQQRFSDLDASNMALELQYTHPEIPEGESVVPVEVTRDEWLRDLAERFCIARLYTPEKALAIIESTCEWNRCGHCEINACMDEIKALLGNGDNR